MYIIHNFSWMCLCVQIMLLDGGWRWRQWKKGISLESFVTYLHYIFIFLQYTTQSVHSCVCEYEKKNQKTYIKFHEILYAVRSLCIIAMLLFVHWRWFGCEFNIMWVGYIYISNVQKCLLPCVWVCVCEDLNRIVYIIY